MARLQLDDSFFANVYGYNWEIFKVKEKDAINSLTDFRDSVIMPYKAKKGLDVSIVLF